MNADQIKAYFDAHSRPSEIFDMIPSTNAYLKECRKDAGTLVIALSQSAGHGQYDRVFESPRSGLYMSVCVDFRPGIPMTLAAANAVTDTLYACFGISCAVKWVNDIIANGKKLCGILAESVFKGDDSYTVVGFGLNIKKGVLSREISDIAVSLEELLGEDLPEDILAPLALGIVENLEKELARDKQEIVERYKKRCLTGIPEGSMLI